MDEKTEKSYKRKLFSKIKSNFILKQIFNDLDKKVSLEIIRYNKRIKKRLNKDINNYKKYLQIIIEIIPKENIYGSFINISNNENKCYYHIYFNDDRKEIQRNYIIEDDKVDKIKIGIDYEIKNLYGLFKECKCIKILNFIQFNRKVIDDMSYLFSRYSSLEEINFSKFITNNITNMSYIFYECSSLKRLNLSNFNTNNVIDMRGMFYGCSSLEELNLSNFNINDITNISYIFYKCSSLKFLTLENFDNNKIEDILIKLNKGTSLKIQCSKDLKRKIRKFGYGNFVIEKKKITLNGFKRSINCLK